MNYANSAGTSTYLSRIWQRSNNCLSDDIPVENRTTFYMFDSDTSNKPTSAAGFMIANGWDWGKGGSIIAQVFDDGDGGRLYTNFRQCDGSWNSWKKVAFTSDIPSTISWSNVTGKPFNWSGQSGQPTWLWGSNDGTNYYVWNPRNFNVSYANSAGSAPASDVYSWAKASTKPSYIASEVMYISLVEISTNTSSSCSITGSGNEGKAETLIYVNDDDTDHIVTVPTRYITPDNEKIELTCPAYGGYCEVSYLNIGGTIYARGL